MAADNPDACIPDAITNLVFDLYDSVVTSQILEEQASLYNVVFRDLSQKYYATSPWPSPQSIASECNGDPLFLALYRELTHRHLHSVTRPTVRDRVEGWHVYRELFDELIQDTPESLLILPGWAFDILNEFVYQFQGYCQLRTSLAAKVGETTKHHVTENIQVLEENPDAWAVETVLFYLHRLVSIGKSSKIAAFQHLGLFASVTLSRLECLLCDYRACLSSLAPVYQQDVTIMLGEESTTPLDVVAGVFPARLSMIYHAGVSYLMLRRYKDAIRILGDLCAYMQRGFKTGQLRKLPGSEQFNKQYDRMLALLAILTHICPASGLVEDSVARVIRDKHSSQLSKIDLGEEGYEDMFVFACPKFVSPALPDYTGASSGGANDAYKLQVKHFMDEMSTQQSMRKLRSYMKLYTSITVSKLAAFNDTTEEEFLPNLVAFKHRMNQMENVGGENADPLGGAMTSALDIHYYISDDMIHVDEAEKQRRFENYFMTQIAHYGEIMKDVEAISTKV